MANQEHLDILSKGVDEWNAWRQEFPFVTPDLSNNGGGWDLPIAPLNGVEFADAYMRGSDLSHAHFIKANFHQANLECATLSDAVLCGANFLGATLDRSNFEHANLRGASFRLASLRGVNFTAAILDQADFADAILDRTLLDDVSLETVRGLNTVFHRGPSTIGIDTIYRSQGKIPESFLRGAGVPENFITYMKSLTGAAFDFYSVFISYSTKDQEFAERLYADLQAKGVRCWFAPHDMQGGKKLHEQIDEAIKVYDKLLLILSDASMNSNWVKTEIANARAKEQHQRRQMLFPVGIAPFDRVRSWKCFDADIGIDSAREIREYFIPDFSNWKDHDSYAVAFERLLRDLKARPWDTVAAQLAP